MPIQTTWDDEQRSAVRYIFDGSWTWDDLKAAFDTAHQLLDTIDYSADTVIDMRASKTLPDHAISGIRRIGIDQVGHPNHSRLTVFVGLSLFAKQILFITMRTFKSLQAQNDFHFADTIEEARAIIRRERAQTPA